MRKRNRGNWPLIAHQYWIRPEFREWFDMPVPLQAEAGQMRDLWNQLTSTFDQNGQEYEAILSQNLKVQELKEKTNNLKEEFEKAKRALKSAKQRLRRQTHPELTSFQEAKKQAKEELNKAREELKEAKKNAREEALPSIKELWDKFRVQTEGLFEKCSTSYSNKEFIFNCFGAAVRKFLTGKGKRPKQKSGLPREVHFHHRFGSSGLPVERIFGRGQRLHLQPIPEEALDPTLKQRRHKRLARTTGTFQVGDVAIPFQTILHRPLPQEAYLKSAALVGRLVIGRGYHYHQEGDSGHSIPARWDWSLLLTFEVPPREVPERQESEPVAGLDLNYRMWEDGSLRVGVLLDSTGCEKHLFLPNPAEKAPANPVGFHPEFCLCSETALHFHTARSSRVAGLAGDESASSLNRVGYLPIITVSSKGSNRWPTVRPMKSCCIARFL